MIQLTKYAVDMLNKKQSSVNGNGTLMMKTGPEPEWQHSVVEMDKEIAGFNDLIINAIPYFIYSCDNSGRFTSVNQAICQLLNKPFYQFIGKTNAEIGFPETVCKKWDELHQTLYTSKEVVKTIESVIMPNGSINSYEIELHPFHGEDSEIIGIGGIIKDLTKLTTEKSEIMELYKSFEHLIEKIPNPVIVEDNEGKWMTINDAAKKLFNLTDNNWRGKTAKILAGEQKEFAALHWSMSLSNEKAWKSGKMVIAEEKITDIQGNSMQYEFIKLPMLTTTGKRKRKRLIVIGNEITQKNREKEYLQLLETVVTNSLDAVVITEAYPYVNPGPRIIFVNDAYLKMTGFSREEIIGKTPRILQGINTDREELKRMRKSMEIAEPCKIEVINYKKNREEFWSSISVSPVINEKGFPTHWVGIKRDITEDKKMEQEIKKAIIKGQEAEKYFLGRELHDNVSQLLICSILSLGMIKPVKEHEAQFVDETRVSISKAIEEIRQLSHQLAPATFKDNTFVSTVEDLLKSINKQNGYKIITHFEKINHIKFHSDIQLNLYRILQEQLQNIIKHAEATAIEVSVIIKAKMVRMRIADNGKGFKTKSKTLGIGLQNIKSRAEIFSGFFHIKSSPKNGCELLVRIPLSK